jgi:hypothetical protein
MWTQRSGAPDNSVERRSLSSQRVLSFCAMGTRVGLIFRLIAGVPVNVSRDQNFAAVRPSGKPSGVIARLPCNSIPQMTWRWWRPCFILCPRELPVKPIFPVVTRAKKNPVVSCKIRTGPPVDLTRMAVGLKWPASILSSLTLSCAKNRYAAFVLARYRNAVGSVFPAALRGRPASCPVGGSDGRRPSSHVRTRLIEVPDNDS